MKLPLNPFLAAAAIAACFLPTLPAPLPSVAHGTHAPEAAKLVWRAVNKQGQCASAFPVRRKGMVWVFITAGHVIPHLQVESIVETPDKLRKLVVTHVERHPDPEVDLGFLYATADGQPVELLTLDLNGDRSMGRSVFAAGFPGPTKLWFVTRGYIGVDGEWFSAPVWPGMSGGPVMDNEGRVIGVVRAFAREAASFEPFYGQSLMVPLKVAEKWIIEKHLLVD